MDGLLLLLLLFFATVEMYEIKIWDKNRIKWEVK